MNETGRTIVALYLRVSTREQALTGYSLDAQERLLIDYCKAKKYEIYKVYVDEGVSAKDIKNRPGLMALLADAKEKRFGLILVWKLTRFSRNMADLTAVCELLDCLGIALTSYSEAFDSGTPAGRMMRSVLGTVGQFEREVIAENVAMGLLERAMQGKRTCGNVVGYDHCGRDSFSINEEESKYVKFVFTEYMIRKNISEVARKAVEKGFKGKKGRLPHSQSVYVILTNPVYAGYNVFKGEIYKGDYESIIDVQTFNSVQQLIKRQGKLVGQIRTRKLHIIKK